MRKTYVKEENALRKAVLEFLPNPDAVLLEVFIAKDLDGDPLATLRIRTHRKLTESALAEKDPRYFEMIAQKLILAIHESMQRI